MCSKHTCAAALFSLAGVPLALFFLAFAFGVTIAVRRFPVDQALRGGSEETSWGGELVVCGSPCKLDDRAIRITQQ